MIAIRRAPPAALRERTPCEDNFRSIGVFSRSARGGLSHSAHPLPTVSARPRLLGKPRLTSPLIRVKRGPQRLLAGLKIVRKRNHQAFPAGTFRATPSRAADLDDASGRA